jgi:hypothetical protein
MIAQVRQISRSSMQPEKAGDKENHHDDTDDVENVHCVLQLGHARFQYESAALQYERRGLQVSSKAAEAIRRQKWSILYRLTSSTGTPSGRVAK